MVARAWANSSGKVTHYGVRARDVDAALMGGQLVADFSCEFAPFVRPTDTFKSPVTNMAPYVCRSRIWLSRHRSSRLARKLGRLHGIRLSRISFVQNDAASRHDARIKSELVTALAAITWSASSSGTIRGCEEPYQESSSAL